MTEALNRRPIMAPEAHEESGDIPRQLHANSGVVLGAHEADLREAIESVRWKRRGILQSLARQEGLRAVPLDSIGGSSDEGAREPWRRALRLRRPAG